MVYVLPQKILYSQAKTTNVHVRNHPHGGSGGAAASDSYIDGALLNGGTAKGTTGGENGNGSSKEPLNSSF